jgi:hypothetical protein
VISFGFPFGIALNEMAELIAAREPVMRKFLLVFMVFCGF